jgi:hypothetical protein
MSDNPALPAVPVDEDREQQAPASLALLRALVRVDGLNTANEHAPELGRDADVRAFAAGLATAGVVDQPTRDDFVALVGRLGVTGTRDVNDLVQQVLRESYLSSTQDLSFYAQKVAFYDADGVFDHITTLENPSVVWTVPDPIASTNEEGVIVSYNKARAAVISYFERSYLKQLYEHCHGNVSKAARLADMDRGHLADLLRRHGIHSPSE